MSHCERENTGPNSSKSGRERASINFGLLSSTLPPPTNSVARLLFRLLIGPWHVATGIAEPRGDFRCIAADGLHEFAPVGDYGVDCCGNIVDHDVDHEAGRAAGGRPVTQVPLTCP